MRTRACPSWTACGKESTMMQMQTVLYTTDFSDSSKSAFPLAYSLSRDHGARLIVLHVLPAGTYEIVNLAQLGQGESPQQFEDDIRHDLQRIQRPDDRVAMEYKLAKGDPAAFGEFVFHRN